MISISNLKENFKNNWKSGISVALVSVPLSFSLAIAAGASPMTGIITAVWAGIIGGIFGGSQFNILGPAGALTGILIGYSILYSPAILPIISVISGLIILAIWALKWDRYLVFIPSSVVHGFTLGVAFTIAFSQLNSILGLNGLPIHESVVGNISESIKHVSLISWPTTISFILGLIFLFVILKYKPSWPNAIIVAILGIFFGYLSTSGMLPFVVQTIGTKYPTISGNLFLFPNLSDFFRNSPFAILSQSNQITVLIKASTVIAFVIVLETLISAKTADGMTKTRFNQTREVLGVGLANIASGIFGGLPASGVFARTALNVKTGAKSSFSQIINALVVGLISVVFISGFKYLPLSITAAILVYASIRMIAREHFVKMFALDKNAFKIAIIVAGLTFVYDATVGILVGALASLLLFADSVSKSEFGSSVNPESYSLEEESEKAIIYRFPGTLTYLNSRSHIERISRIKSDKPIILNFRYLHSIDVDGYEALDEIAEILLNRKQKMYLTGIKPEWQASLSHHAWFNNLVAEKKTAATNDEILKII